MTDARARTEQLTELVKLAVEREDVMARVEELLDEVKAVPPSFVDQLSDYLVDNPDEMVDTVVDRIIYLVMQAAERISHTIYDPDVQYVRKVVDLVDLDDVLNDRGSDEEC